MDFVVVGFGLGALIVLVGIAVRDLAPRLRRADVVEPTGDRMRELYSIKRVTAARWADACHRAARAIMLGGGAIILAAVAGIVAGLDNSDGAHLVLAVALVAVGAFAVRLGMLANELFPIDRRSREQAWELVQRAKPAPATPSEAPQAKPAATAEVTKPETAVAAAAADVPTNGASEEAIPAEVEAARAEEQPETVTGEEGKEAAEEAKGAPIVEAEEPSVAEAGEGVEAAEAATGDSEDDTKDQKSGTVEEEAKVGEGDGTGEDAAPETAAAKEAAAPTDNESDEAREPSEVAVSGRTIAEA